MSRYARNPVSGSIMPVAGMGGGSGGHTIVNSFGTEMTQRSKLQFKGCTVTDNSSDDTTEVEAEAGVDMTYSEYSQLTPQEQANIDAYVPDYPEQPGYADNAPRAGSQAYVTSDGLNNIIGTEDITGVGTTIKGAIANLGERFNYSTTEKIVGKWLDGKDLYQKVLTFPDIGTNNVYYTFAALGATPDYFTVLASSMTDRFGQVSCISRTNNEDTTYYDLRTSDGQLGIFVNSLNSKPYTNITATVLYTKTTS